MPTQSYDLTPDTWTSLGPAPLNVQTISPRPALVYEGTSAPAIDAPATRVVYSERSDGHNATGPGQTVWARALNASARIIVSPIASTDVSRDKLVSTLSIPVAPVRVGLFGDSRAALNHFPFGDGGAGVPTALVTVNGSTGDYLPTKGFAFYAQMLSGARLEFPRAGNYGIGGQNTGQMVARVEAAAAAMQAAGCSWVVIIAGTNDGAAGISLAQSVANYATIEAAFAARGLGVLWLAEYPRGHATATANRLTGAALQDHYGRRRAILGRANGVSVFALDTMLFLSDNGSTTPGDIIAAMTYDGLHLNGRGSYFVGRQITEFFNARMPVRDFLPSNNADVWSASNPGGALNPNPCMVGATGGKASGVTGELADGYGQGNLPAGMALAMSKGVDANGRVFQQAAISGTPTGGFPNMDLLRRDATIGTGAGQIAPGSKVRVACEYEWDAAPTGLWCLDAFCLGALRASAGAEQSDAANSVMPAQAVSGVAITPEQTLGTTGIVRSGVRVYAVQNAAVSATVRIKRMALLYVA